jgi:hypothetical protein
VQRPRLARFGDEVDRPPVRLSIPLPPPNVIERFLHHGNAKDDTQWNPRRCRIHGSQGGKELRDGNDDKVGVQRALQLFEQRQRYKGDDRIFCI